MKIHGQEYPINKIFSDDFAFVIPHYQRPYAWEEEHASELLDDLLTSLGENDNIPIEQLPPYFLGCVVLIKNENQAEAIVVDGQQRLMTLTILLSVLREILDGDHAEDITQFLYTKGNKMLGTDDSYRLTARERDAVFFRKYVQEVKGLQKLEKIDQTPLTDSQSNICTNSVSYLRQLRGISGKRRFRLAQFTLTRCVMVVVSSQDKDSAYRIFSILNDRGLDLSHSDILKAEIIGKLSDDLQDGYAKKWENMEEELGRNKFDDLFAHIRMIFRRTKLRETVLKEFREYVVSEHPPQELIDNVLLPFGDAYTDILFESYESTSEAQDINALLHWLNQIDNFDWIPPAIKYLTDHKNESDLLLKFFKDLERVAAGMMILRTSITKRIERYGRLLKAMSDRDDLYTEDSPLQLSGQEKTEITKALDGPIYLLSRVPLYVLLRLDNELSSGSATYNYPVISIEHVLPQKPEPDSEWIGNFPDDDEREKRTHLLGNLVLLSRRKNSSASNYNFEKKKKKYFTKEGASPFVLTSQVIQENVWTPTVIDRRQGDLLDTLKKAWRLS